MSRFIIDAQLPPFFEARILASGYWAVHVRSLRMLQAKDPEIWAKAIELRASILTKDSDFARLAMRHAGPAVVLVRYGNMGREALWLRVERSLPKVVAALAAGEGLISIGPKPPVPRRLPSSATRPRKLWRGRARAGCSSAAP